MKLARFFPPLLKSLLKGFLERRFLHMSQSGHTYRRNFSRFTKRNSFPFAGAVFHAVVPRWLARIERT